MADNDTWLPGPRPDPAQPHTRPVWPQPAQPAQPQHPTTQAAQQPAQPPTQPAQPPTQPAQPVEPPAQAAGQPAQPQHPTVQPAPYPVQFQHLVQHAAVPPYPATHPAAHPTQRPAVRRPVARRIGVVAVVLAVALGSGLVGGAVGHRLDTDRDLTAPAGVTRVVAPQQGGASVADVAAAVQPSVVNVATGSGEGSGVILSADGTILTNNHVVAGATGGTVTITFSDGRKAQATVVGTDPAGDLAVLRAQGVSGLTAATFGDSGALRVGDTVLALGSPLGLQGSVTQGIVSALNRTISEEGGQSIGNAIQTDAAINPGNSGGPLVNLAGQVVGINTAIASAGEGSGSIGVGFAIASNTAKRSADQLLTGGTVVHPYLGVRFGSGDGGALVAEVVSGGPAERAGVRQGDLIVRAGTVTVGDADDLIAAVQSAKPGDPLPLVLRRDGAQQELTVTVGTAP